MKPHNSTPASPRYKAIAAQLLHEIESGTLAVGSLMPSDKALGAKYEASRGTIRQSLAVLTEAGLIVRRQRSGTHILAKFPVRGLVDRDRILEDWARYGVNYPLRIMSVVRAVPPKEFLTGEKRIARVPWLAVTGLRYPPSARIPISYCQAYIRPSYADIAKHLSSAPIPIFSLIEQRYGRVIEVIRTELRSITLSPTIAKELAAEPGSPALQLIRLFTDGRGRIVEIAVNTHPAARYTYRMEILRAPNEDKSK